MKTLIFAVLLLMAIANGLDVLDVEGDHYQVGFAIGSRFKTEILQRFHGDEDMGRVLSFIKQKDGAGVYHAFENTVTTMYPEYVDEIRGMADALGVPFDTVLTANMMAELSTFVGGKRITDCSDILLKDDKHALITHNEDNNNGTLHTSFIVRAKIHSNSSETTSYTSFHYPGQIAGDSFGFNSHGILFSTNALFPSNIRVGGIPRLFLGRDLLAAKSVEDFLARVNARHFRASGFSINLGSIHDGRLFNLELAPTDFAVKEVTEGAYGHFNQYLRLSPPRHDSPSSDHRLARFQAMGQPSSLQEMLNILGDNEDKLYPIYRDGSPPDTAIVTICTAVFDLKQRTLSVFSSNPKTSAGPELVFDMTK